METIKNLLRPGNADDDQTLYGQNNPGHTTDAKHQKEGLTGEGSHLAGSHGQTNLPGQGSSTNTAGTNTHHTGGLTGEGSHLAGSKESTNIPGQHQHSGLTQGSNDPSSISRNTDTNTTTHHAEGLSGQGSHLAGSQQTTHISGQQSTPFSSGRGDGLSQPGSQQYPINTGAESSNTHSGSTTAPHNSNLLNKLDPRVDSDQSKVTTSGDHTGRNAGLMAGASGLASRDHDSSQGNTTLGGSGTHAKSTEGPHQSDMLNKADPRVDSDNSRNINSGAGAGARGYSSTGDGSQHHTGGIGSTTHGPHHTETANRLDPNIDSSSHTRTEDATRHHETYGGGAEAADNDHRDGGKKAAVAGAVGLGAIGMGSASHQSRFTERGADFSNPEHQSTMPGSFPAESSSATGGDFQPGATQHGNENIGIPDRTRATHDSSVGDRTTHDPSSSVGEKEHHYGRDATLGAGAAGLGGAAYGASKHSDNKTSEPVHQSDALNRADPRVDNQPSGVGIGTNLQDRSHDIMTGDTTSHQTSTATHHDSNPINRGDQTVDSDRSKDHHYGRDAAIGAGVAGAGYGVGKHHESQPQGVSSTTTYPTTTTTTTTSTSTEGANPSHLINRGHPRVESDRSHGNDNDLIDRGNRGVDSSRTDGKEKEKDHNYGRDAALVGGGVGAAAYGAHKYDERDDDALKQAEKDRKHAEKEQKHEQKEHDKVVHAQEKDRKHAEKEQHHAQKEHDKAVHAQEKQDKQNEKDQKHAEKEQKHAQKEHDKAVYAHEKQDKQNEKDQRHAEREHEKQLRDNEKLDTKDEKHAEKKEHKGLFSFLHRDKNKKYTKDEEDEFDRQERDHNARNVAGGAAVAGAGTYAAQQHHSTHDSSNTGNTHAAEQSKGHTPLVDQPEGTTIGDKLHGVARNRGVQSSTGYPDGGAPKDPINHHTGEKLDTGDATNLHEGQHKPSLGEKLHGHGASSSNYPEGGASRDSTNQHTGEKLAAGTAVGAGAGTLGHGHNTTQHGNVARNDGYDTNPGTDLTDTTREKSTSDREYNYPQGGSNVTSPTSAQYTHSQSTANPGSAGHDSTSAAPRHLTSDHSTDERALDSNSGVKTDQGVAAGVSHDTAGHEGRNRLHKDMPAKVAADRNL